MPYFTRNDVEALRTLLRQRNSKDALVLLTRLDPPKPPLDLPPPPPPPKPVFEPYETARRVLDYRPANKSYPWIVMERNEVDGQLRDRCNHWNRDMAVAWMDLEEKIDAARARRDYGGAWELRKEWYKQRQRWADARRRKRKKNAKAG